MCGVNFNFYNRIRSVKSRCNQRYKANNLYQLGCPSSKQSVICSDQPSLAKTHFRDHIPVASRAEVCLNQVQCLVLLTVNTIKIASLLCLACALLSFIAVMNRLHAKIKCDA